MSQHTNVIDAFLKSYTLDISSNITTIKNEIMDITIVIPNNDSLIHGLNLMINGSSIKMVTVILDSLGDTVISTIKVNGASVTRIYRAIIRNERIYNIIEVFEPNCLFTYNLEPRYTIWNTPYLKWLNDKKISDNRAILSVTMAFIYDDGFLIKDIKKQMIQLLFDSISQDNPKKMFE